jgi:hypothetical protein
MNHAGILITLAILLFAGVIVFAAFWARTRYIGIWFTGYIRSRFLKRRYARPRPSGSDLRHVLFCFVDHFEPGWNKADAATQDMRVAAWKHRYPVMARQFCDADGIHPRHTWFYPPHYYKEEHLASLVGLCRDGLGEIELHLHHNRIPPFPETAFSLQEKIAHCQELYGRMGVFRTIEGEIERKRYAFIHGDWALDNSRPEHCGVNNEITLLKESGCYADFTFPAYRMPSQPRQANSVYYAVDDPGRPKSYDRGIPVVAGGRMTGDLMIIQGPIGFRWKGRRHLLVPSIDDGEIAASNLPTPDRVDFWINTGIHVAGKPEWIIAKIFTHGAPESEHEVLLGEPIVRMHQYLASRYNDGNNFRLHYVTARELYNIIKAAEAGNVGDPCQYRNYEIPPYMYVNN